MVDLLIFRIPLFVLQLKVFLRYNTLKMKMFKYLFFLFTFLISIANWAQTKAEYSIGFLLEKNTGEIESLLEGLKKEITAVSRKPNR